MEEEETFLGPGLAAVRARLLEEKRLREQPFVDNETSLEKLALQPNEFLVTRFLPNAVSFYRKISRFAFVTSNGKHRKTRYCSVILLPTLAATDELVFVGQSDRFNARAAMASASREFSLFSGITERHIHEHGTAPTGKKGGVIYYTGKRENAKQVVATHPVFLGQLREAFHIDHDPCPVAPTADAMIAPWGRVNFVNPPFRHFGAFAMRATELALSGEGTRSILIGPATIYSNAFASVVHSNALLAVAMLRRDTFFQGYDTPPPFSLFLLFIGPPTGREEATADKHVPLFFVDCGITKSRRKKPSTSATSFAEIRRVLGW